MENGKWKVGERGNQWTIDNGQLTRAGTWGGRGWLQRFATECNAGESISRSAAEGFGGSSLGEGAPNSSGHFRTGPNSFPGVAGRGGTGRDETGQNGTNWDRFWDVRFYPVFGCAHLTFVELLRNDISHFILATCGWDFHLPTCSCQMSPDICVSAGGGMTRGRHGEGETGGLLSAEC
jgi:hypothetical protein